MLFYYSCPNYPPLLSHALPTSSCQYPPCCPCPWVIYTCSLTRPFPFFPALFPSLLPSGPCQFVPCFHASGSINVINSGYMLTDYLFSPLWCILFLFSMCLSNLDEMLNIVNFFYCILGNFVFLKISLSVIQGHR